MADIIRRQSKGGLVEYGASLWSGVSRKIAALVLKQPSAAMLANYAVSTTPGTSRKAQTAVRGKQRLKPAALLAAAAVMGLAAFTTGCATGMAPSQSAGQDRTSATDTSSPAGGLPTVSGTLDQWLAAVCFYGPGVQPHDLNKAGLPFMTFANRVIRCTSRPEVAGSHYAILGGVYDAASDAYSDLKMTLRPLGAYAIGRDPSTGLTMLFAMQNNDPARGLSPLAQFGFKLGRAIPPDPAPNFSTNSPGAVPPRSSIPQQPPTQGSSTGAYTERIVQSKSGKIACKLLDTASGRGSVTCEVRQHTFQPKVLSGCQPDWPNRFELDTGDQVAVFCYRDSIFPGGLPVWDYGQPLEAGSIACVLDRASGVTCKDASTGHFFRASADAYEWR